MPKHRLTSATIDSEAQLRELLGEPAALTYRKVRDRITPLTRKLIEMRRQHPVFCRRKWFQGVPIKGVGVEDIAWFLPDGSEMSDEHWNTSFAKSLGIYLNGRDIHMVTPEGEPVLDDSFYIIFNAHHESLEYTLPPEKYGKQWKKILNTFDGVVAEGQVNYPGDKLQVEGRSIILLLNPKA